MAEKPNRYKSEFTATESAPRIKRTGSIGFRLSLLVATAIIILAALSIHVVVKRQESDYRDEKTRQWNILIESITPTLTILMASSDIDGIRHVLDTILSEENEINYVYLTNEFDEIVYSTDMKLENSVMSADLKSTLSTMRGTDPIEGVKLVRFVKHIKTGTSSLGVLYMGFTYLPALEKERIRSVLTLENAIQGAVKKNLLEFDFFQVHFLTKEMIRQTRNIAYFKIISSDGIIISSLDEGEILRNTEDPFDLTVLARSNIRKPVWTRKLLFDGVPVQEVTLPMFQDRNLVGIIRVGYDLSAMDASIRRGRIILAVIIITSMLLAIGVAMIIARSISAPVVSLAKTARQVGAGNLDVEAGVRTGGDELRLLGTAFNQMIGGLREKERLKEQKLKLDHEMFLGRRIQTSLMPQTDPVVAGYKITGANLPALEVSGDYYDFFPLNDGRLAIVIGDVTGKGVPAALVTTMVRMLIRSECARSSSLCEIMINANRVIFDDISNLGFVTTIFAALDPGANRLTFVNSGHNSGIYIQPDGNVQLLDSSAPPVGALESESYDPMVEESSINFEPGGMAVLYTDGIVEAVDPSDEEFGMERLIDVLKANRHLQGQELIKAVTDAVDEFIAGHEHQDDITMVVITRSAAPPRPA